MSPLPASVDAHDGTERLLARLRSLLAASGEGGTLDTGEALQLVARLERVVALLRRTALHGFDAFEHRVHELSLVRRIGELFASVFELDRLSQALVDLVEAAMACGNAFLFLYEPADDLPSLRAWTGADLDDSDRDAAERVAQVAARNADPTWIPDTTISEDLFGLPPTRVRSVLGCPLVALGQAVGVIVVSEPEVGALDEEQGRLLRPIADLAAMAVCHARVCAQNLASQRDLEAIVERRTREVNEARAALSRHERVAAMGKLAASIAHEVNNPMSFLLSNLERAVEYRSELAGSVASLLERAHGSEAGAAGGDGDPPLRPKGRVASGEGPDEPACALLRDLEEVLSEAREGAERVRHVGEQLRSFAQGIAGVMEPVDLNSLVETALHIVRAEAKNVTFECRFGVLPQVRCQRYQVTQVLLNLLQNAVEAIEGNGSVRVTTRVTGGRVEVEVADDGPGVPEEELARIFEPFHTTKQTGSGLGLSISRDIAHAHRGSLEAQPAAGGGLFTLRLPIGGPGPLPS